MYKRDWLVELEVTRDADGGFELGNSLSSIRLAEQKHRGGVGCDGWADDVGRDGHIDDARLRLGLIFLHRRRGVGVHRQL